MSDLWRILYAPEDEGSGEPADQGGAATAEASAEEGGGDTGQPTGGGSFLDSLPDDLKGSESLESFAKAENPTEALARAFVKTKSMVGANTVKVPGKNASDEEVQDFRKALGVPEKPDDYELPTDGLPENVQIESEEAGSIKNIAHDLGLSPTQTAKLYRHYADIKSQSETERQQFSEQSREQSLGKLKQEWGQAFDQNIDLAKRAMSNLVDDDFKQFLDDSGLGNHPEMAKLFARIGRSMAEDEITGGGSGRSFKMSPAEAQAELSKLVMDPEKSKALTDKNHPAHRTVVDERQKLYEAMYASS